MGKISKPARSLLIFAVLSLLWMGVIYAFSARNSMDSAAMSGKLLRKLLSVLVPKWQEMAAGEQAALIRRLHRGFRKLGHFSEYAVLGLLLTETVHALLIQTSRLTLPKAEVWLPALLSLLYAAGDEFHQRFVSGRSGELRDVGIDFAGACFGIGIFFAGSAIIQRIRIHKKKSRPQENE
ncbi:MAG: VanZ family protein [Oscillospiraceae bacterium]|nr:VanZ family protein [Oscillospiraceae bacterium]